MILSKNLSLVSLLKSGFSPTLEDFNQFLLLLFQSRRFKCIVQLFSQMKSNQITGDSRTNTIFAKALMEDHKYDEALIFLKAHMSRTKNFPQNRIFDTLIQGFCKNKSESEKGLFVLREFLRIYGIVPSSFTFCSLIYSFSSQGKMDRVIEVLELMTNGKFKYPFDNFVCSSVISGFVRIGNYELAIGFYENAVKSGAFEANLVTYTALLNAYFRLGRIEEVYDLVSRMKKKGLTFDAVFYSCWIHWCFGEGMVKEALQKYQEMVDSEVQGDTITYTILIDGFCKDGNVEKAVGFLHRMIKDGLRPNLVTYSAIMLGFCKKGKLQEAFQLFKIVEDFGMQVDEFVYAILIDGVCRKGDFNHALQLLEEMEKNGIKPSIVTYNTVVNGLCKAGRNSSADDMSQGVVGDVITYSTLLHGYIEEGNTMGLLETKRRFETAGICVDVVMCNILIKALFMLGLFEDALAIYKGMPEMNLVANSLTYFTMIDGYCKTGRIDEALEIFDDFRRTSNSSASCYDCIVRTLCRKGMVDMAIEVFMELIGRGVPIDRTLNVMLFNATFNEKGEEGVLELVHRIENVGSELFSALCNDAITFLCRKGSSNIVFNVFMVMRRNESILTSKSYYQMLKTLLFDGKWLFSPIILSSFVKEYGMSEPRVNRILVDYMCMKDVRKAGYFVRNLQEKHLSITFSVSVLQMLIKDGRALDAYKLIVESKTKLPDTDVVTYSILISSLCKEHVDKALDLCDFVRNKGISLSIAIYNAVLNGLCRQGCFIEALRLFDSLEKIGMLPSEITYGTLIDALSKEGCLVAAGKLLESMFHKNIRPNTRIYNSLINGYCKFGRLQEALKLIRDLELDGLKPDGFTVSAVIYGYCQTGDMEGALGFLSEFKTKGISPDFLGFMYLIRGLCAKGRLEESRSILRQMLHNQSVIDLLNRIDSGVGMESVHNFLVVLCERGSIKEAIDVLDEVGSIFFPVGRKSNTENGHAKLNEPCDMHVNDTEESKTSLNNCETYPVHRSYNDERVDNILSTSVNLETQISQSQDFESYYEIAASLCSRGEISKANELVKIISSFS